MNISGIMIDKIFENQNISLHDLEHFATYFNLTRPPTNLSLLNTTIANSNCDHYCAGFIRDLLGSYKSIHGYISLVICLFGTIANILNIIVLTRKDMSKQPINRILKWLAVADMFVMIDYIPFSIYMYIIFPEQKEFKYSWAVFLLFHMHFTQILHTISISLTVTLAIWRFIAIKHPHGQFASIVLSHCSEAILLCFIIAPILCLPTFFVFTINEQQMKDVSSNRTYSVYKVLPQPDTIIYRVNFWIHSIIIKLFPCFILTIISFILIRVLCQAAKRKVKLKGGYETPSSGSALNGHHRRPSKCDRRTDRTTMLLLAVLLLFLLTEFPQGILGLLSGIQHNCFFTQCYNLFGEFMDLLALINAAVGFVLYGLMSKQFRTNFKAVFGRKTPNNVEMAGMTGVTTGVTCV